MYEAHVEHGVRLVEHEILQLAEVDKALVDQVEQSSWSGHHDVHTTLERGHLFALLHTTKNHRMGDGEVGRIVPNALADLGRQFACGAQYQSPNGAAAISLWLSIEPVEHGQRKRCCLSGSGLGHTQNVTSIEDVRNGLSLNGGRGLVAKWNEGLHNGFAQTERIEICQKNRVWRGFMILPLWEHACAVCYKDSLQLLATTMNKQKLAAVLPMALWTVNPVAPRAGFRPAPRFLAIR